MFVNYQVITILETTFVNKMKTMTFERLITELYREKE